jgi:hypothetical protein
MDIVNLTPHKINILRAGSAGYEEVLSVPPSGMVARLAVERKEVNNITFANNQVVGSPVDGLGGIAFYKSIFGEPSDLPEQNDHTIYIVSSLFRSGFDREDLWVPGELIRDTNGQPIGCLGLSR